MLANAASAALLTLTIGIASLRLAQDKIAALQSLFLEGLPASRPGLREAMKDFEPQCFIPGGIIQMHTQANGTP